MSGEEDGMIPKGGDVDPQIANHPVKKEEDVMVENTGGVDAGSSSAADSITKNEQSKVPASSQPKFDCLSCLPLFRHATSQVEMSRIVQQDHGTIRIARIRAELRMVEEGPFTPSIVHIGPYHEYAQLKPLESNRAETDGKGKKPSENDPAETKGENPWKTKYVSKKRRKGLRKIEEEKERLANKFLTMLLNENKKKNPELTLDSQRAQVIEELEKLQKSAWDCYHDLDMQPADVFVRMMMHDGIYVLNLLVELEEASSSQITSAGRGGEIYLLLDVVFLLENQIPWLVLKGLQKLTGHTDSAFLRDPVRSTLAGGGYIKEAKELRPKEPSHLLHLVHMYLAPISKKPLQTPVDIEPNPAIQKAVPWRRATLYRKYAYVMFKRREFEDGKVESVLDVSLQGRTLLIPCLRIDRYTWTILRNLMALEEHMSERPVTAYCAFMSQLARQAEDVELLEYEGIIEQFIGSTEEVVQAFSNLCKGVINNKTSYLDDIWHRLHKRSESFGNKFMGSFMQKNFGDYVQFSAFLGAVLLLLLQIAQVVIASLSLHRQR